MLKFAIHAFLTIVLILILFSSIEIKPNFWSLPEECRDECEKFGIDYVMKRKTGTVCEYHTETRLLKSVRKRKDNKLLLECEISYDPFDKPKSTLLKRYTKLKNGKTRERAEVYEF